MADIFNTTDATALQQRLAKLSPTAQPQWGKMDVAQMLEHCCVPIETALGDRPTQKSLFGILFGRIAKQQVFKKEHFDKNLPTDPTFKVVKKADFESGKQKLARLMTRMTDTGSNPFEGRKHPIFGNLTSNEWGSLMYKHLDHHFTQFGT